MFRRNPNFDKEMVSDPRYVDGLAKATKEAETKAKQFAPVDEGDYRDGIEVRVVGNEVFLVGTDWKSGLIELGTSDTPAFAPLRRGVRAVGLRIAEK